MDTNWPRCNQTFRNRPTRLAAGGIVWPIDLVLFLPYGLTGSFRARSRPCGQKTGLIYGLTKGALLRVLRTALPVAGSKPALHSEIGESNDPPNR